MEVAKTNKKIKEQIQFVLEDDNELMLTALQKGSDLDARNKQLNRELIKRHEKILAKLDKDKMLNQEDFQLVRDANEIHVNDDINCNGRHKEGGVPVEQGQHWNPDVKLWTNLYRNIFCFQQ